MVYHYLRCIRKAREVMQKVRNRTYEIDGPLDVKDNPVKDNRTYDF